MPYCCDNVENGENGENATISNLDTIGTQSSYPNQWGVLITLRTYSRGKVIGSIIVIAVVVIVVVVVDTKITKSRKMDVGQSALCHQAVESHEKVSHVCFKLLRTTHKHYKLWASLAMPIEHTYQCHVLSCFHCVIHSGSMTMLNLKIGKGRQFIKFISIYLPSALAQGIESRTNLSLSFYIGMYVRHT